MVTLAVSAEGPGFWESWHRAFAEVAPELDVVSWYAPGFDPAQADYALVWDPEPGDLARLTRIRGLLCSGAGVNHLVHRPDFPHHVPLVRMGGDDTAVLMADYVLWAAIGLLRDCRTWALQQETRVWRRNLEYRTSRGTKIGILGFGNLGAYVARSLAANGFEVSAWCRRERPIEDIPLFFGAESLTAFLESLDILVNLLPSTPQTQGIIDAGFLAQMKDGAGFINAGRGTQVVEADLLAALASGRIERAVLDVFATEPLGEASPFWTHPQVTVTPHIAAEASPKVQAAYVAQAIREMEAGETPALLYDAKGGY